MSKYQLGTWDLSELASDKNQSFQTRIKKVKNLANKFEKTEKLNPDMPARQFMGILSKLEEISQEINNVWGYASLSYSADTQSDVASQLLTTAHKVSSDISNKILFFDLWWKNQIDEKNAARLLKDAGELSGYLAHKRLFAKHSLSEPEEKIINTLEVTGVAALVKLYERITSAFQYKIKIRGKNHILTREELVNHTRSTSSRVREAAYCTLLTKYVQNKGVLGEIYQNVALNWNDEGIEIRGYDSPISVRNLGNNIDDKTTKSLLASCRKNSPVFQKFFAHKAKMLKIKRLCRYDLYAPVTRGSGKKKYSYGKSVRLVLESLGRFSPKLEGMAKKIFVENHIDSEIRPGKRDGAFCSTINPNITPYVQVNFTGRTRDVFTLAHELGHAVHSQAAQDRSVLIQNAPLPLAETASTFSELLLYDNISDKMTVMEKKTTLVEKLDDLYATILRQSFFTIFEMDAHRQIADGTTVDEISDTYLQNLKDQFGSSINLSEDFAIEWCSIPHFYHTPFYCYAYSFGNLLALSLFQRYKKEGKDFVPSYISILAAGGSEKPESLLAEYGFDIGSSGFWQAGFDYIKAQLKDLTEAS